MPKLRLTQLLNYNVCQSIISHKGPYFKSFNKKKNAIFVKKKIMLTKMTFFLITRVILQNLINKSSLTNIKTNFSIFKANIFETKKLNFVFIRKQNQKFFNKIKPNSEKKHQKIKLIQVFIQKSTY